MRTASISFNYVLSHKMRFEGKHYLNDNALSCMSIEKNASKCFCLDDIADVFNPPVFKRQFCKQSGNSVMYFQSSDVSTANETSPVFINKKQVESLNLLVRKNDILITGFGTIGNVRLVSRLQDGVCYANNVCRVRIKDGVYLGYIYAFLSSKYAYAQLNNNASGSVVRYIEAPGVKKTLVPSFPESFQKEVDDLIQESARLREEAADMLSEAERLLKTSANLRDLTPEDYDYFGPRGAGREVSCFVRKRKDITTTTFNAFNLSERIKLCILDSLKQCNTISFYDAIDENKLQSPSGVEVNEVKEGFGIMLINQSDIFNQIIKGKYISKKKKYTKDLLKKGEILIAKIGTLGENETFCKCVYVGEELEGQLVSSAFYRMKPISGIPSGYLYTWLSSDYGFRLLRSSQFGTKQCYPNPAILYKYPIPILSPDIMNEIDQLVKEAHTKRYKANENERKAIRMVEEEIEKWNK